MQRAFNTVNRVMKYEEGIKSGKYDLIGRNPQKEYRMCSYPW